MPKNHETPFRVNIGRLALRTLDVRAPPGTLDNFLNFKINIRGLSEMEQRF
jgi:hypothetical protein